MEATLNEVVLSNTQASAAIRRRVAAGRMRKIAPRLYTTNMIDAPEAIVRRNLWPIVALFCPGAIITDRTAIESRPASDGSVFVIHDRLTDVSLPGLRIRPRRGPAATDDDRPFIDGLRMASPGRALLENLVRSRARSGVPRTLRRSELEAHLEEIRSRDGGADLLDRMRDEARRLAPTLGLEAEMAELDKLMASLLGDWADRRSRMPAALARAIGRRHDPRRLELFEALRVELAEQAPVMRRQPTLDQVGDRNLGFFEAYFSNFIEGIEFGVEEAFDIVFNNAMPGGRAEDAHDLLSTFKITSNPNEMSRTPTSFDGFLELLKARHAVILGQRPAKRPGEFKTLSNRVGDLSFVDPDQIVGTLERGFEVYLSIPDPFGRAAFMMYLVSEVHPFNDGNGRTARIMMNAELVSAGEQRIVVPTIYGSDYLAALRALSLHGDASPYVRMLAFAQDYTRRIPWSWFDHARQVLTETGAFLRPEEADELGVRLRKPTQLQLQEADDATAQNA